MPGLLTSQGIQAQKQQAVMILGGISSHLELMDTMLNLHVGCSLDTEDVCTERAEVLCTFERCL